MRYVEAQGLRTSVIGLGAWQFGSPEWGWGGGFGPAEAQAVVAIPGAKSVAQLESNAAAADIVLGDDEFLHLNQAADRFHRDTLSSATELVARRARTLLRRA